MKILNQNEILAVSGGGFVETLTVLGGVVGALMGVQAGIKIGYDSVQCLDGNALSLAACGVQKVASASFQGAKGLINGGIIGAVAVPALGMFLMPPMIVTPANMMY